MLIAGAALSLLQTAVAALKPDQPSGATPSEASSKSTGKANGHPPGKATPQLSDALQATLNQAGDLAGAAAGTAMNVGRALQAYGARRG